MLNFVEKQAALTNTGAPANLLEENLKAGDPRSQGIMPRRTSVFTTLSHDS